jgi:hypothetical protein
MFGKSLKQEWGAPLKTILELHDWRDRAVIFGGLVRVFTLAQLARFLYCGDMAATAKAIDHLVLVANFLVPIAGLLLPKGLGGGVTTAYYVTDKGGTWLLQHCPQLAKRVRFGRPNDKMTKRIPHELIITEALVRLWPHNEIQDFLPDEELRRRIVRERSRRRRGNQEKLQSEVTGDFVIVLQSSTNPEGEVWRQYEAAVRYSARQMDQKPKEMHWLACTSTQADIIEKVTGGRPLMITSVDRVRPSDENRPSKTFSKGNSLNNGIQENDGATSRGGVFDGAPALAHCAAEASAKPLLESERRALKALEGLGGSATADALAVFAGVNRGNMRRTLNTLANRPLINRDYGSLEPGVSKGRSSALFSLRSTSFDSYHDRVISIARSELVVVLGANGRRLSTYNPSIHEMIFVPTWVDEDTYAVLLDDPRLPIEETRRRMIEIASRWRRPRVRFYCMIYEQSRAPIIKAASSVFLPADIHKSREKRLWKERLSVYLHCLNELSTEGASTVSSQGLADRFDLNADQISRDLASFREIRDDEAAYDIGGLRNSVTKALGLDRDPDPVRYECGQSEHCFERDPRGTASQVTAQSLVR